MYIEIPNQHLRRGAILHGGAYSAWAGAWKCLPNCSATQYEFVSLEARCRLPTRGAILTPSIHIVAAWRL